MKSVLPKPTWANHDQSWIGKHVGGNAPSPFQAGDRIAAINDDCGRKRISNSCIRSDNGCGACTDCRYAYARIDDVRTSFVCTT